MSHAETVMMESVESSTAKLVLTDETNASILIEKAEEPPQTNQKEKKVSTCRAGNGWCKNICKEGQTICDECTKMMDSYP